MVVWTFTHSFWLIILTIASGFSTAHGLLWPFNTRGSILSDTTNAISMSTKSTVPRLVQKFETAKLSRFRPAHKTVSKGWGWYIVNVFRRHKVVVVERRLDMYPVLVKGIWVSEPKLPKRDVNLPWGHEQQVYSEDSADALHKLLCIIMKEKALLII